MKNEKKKNLQKENNANSFKKIKIFFRKYKQKKINKEGNYIFPIFQSDYIQKKY